MDRDVLSYSLLLPPFTAAPSAYMPTPPPAQIQQQRRMATTLTTEATAPPPPGVVPLRGANIRADGGYGRSGAPANLWMNRTQSEFELNQAHQPHQRPPTKHELQAMSPHAPVPPGMHSIPSIPNYPPSYPSKTIFEVAQALPKPPPRASTAMTVQVKGRKKKINQPDTSVVPNPTTANDLPPELAESASQKQPFIFRSHGRAGKVNEWLNDEQKENLVQTWQPSSTQPLHPSISPMHSPSKAHLFTTPSQVALSFTPATFSQTAPLPLATFPPPPPAALMLGPSQATTALSQYASSIGVTPYPAASAGGNKPAEGVFVIRPPASTVKPTVAQPPPPTTAPLPPINAAQSVPTSQRGTHSLRSGQAHASMTNLFPSQQTTVRRPAPIPPKPVAPLPVSIRTRPVNHFIVRPDGDPLDDDQLDGDGEVYRLGPSKRQLTSAEEEAKLAADEAAAQAQREREAAEKQQRNDEVDEMFLKGWAQREELAQPILLQYLASSAGRSLLSSKPSHNFLLPHEITIAYAPHTYPQLAHDFNSILQAADGSALMALWILEKWRLKTQSTGTNKMRQTMKFGNLSELVTAMTRAKQGITKEQKEWMAYITNGGFTADPASHALTNQHQAHSQPIPPTNPLFPSESTRARIALHPHMDALWIRGAGHAAFTLVRQFNESLGSSDSKPRRRRSIHNSHDLTPNDATDGRSGGDHARSPSINFLPPPVQFGNFVEFLDMISDKLQEAKQQIRDDLASMTPIFIDEPLLEILTLPSKNGLPANEYIYVETTERVVGLKSSSTPVAKPVTPKPEGDAPNLSIDLTGDTTLTNTETMKSPTTEPMPASETATTSDSTQPSTIMVTPSTDSDSSATPQVALTTPNEEPAQAQASLTSSSTTSSASDEFVQIEINVSLDGEEVITTLTPLNSILPSDPAVAASSEPAVPSEITTSGTLPTESTVTPATQASQPEVVANSQSEAVSRPASQADVSTEVTIDLSSISRRKSSTTGETHLSAGPSPIMSRNSSNKVPNVTSAPALVLPPIPSVMELVNLDALTTLLHLAQGVIPGLSYLRALCSAHVLNNSPIITKLSFLLTCMQQRSRDFKQHHETLCEWFEQHGHDVIRSLNHDYNSGGASSSGKEPQLVSVTQDLLTINPVPAASAARLDYSRSSTSSPFTSHDLLTADQVAFLYWSGDCGEKTLRYVRQLCETKKKFNTISDLIRRLRKINSQNQADYIAQRAIVKKYLLSDDAILFHTPSNARSPLTFSVNTEDHIDMFLTRCMIPSGQTVPTTTTTPAASLHPPVGTHSHHRSVPSPVVNPPESISAKDEGFISPNWNKSTIDHASGASIVRHLEHIMRQRRQQTIQEYRMKLEASSREGGMDPLLSDKVVQPLLFHDINSLTDYVATLAAKAKHTIEATYIFIASASSSLLLARDDPSYSAGFANPDQLFDFSQSSQWTIQDAKMLFEECMAGHDIGEYAQRVSDAKLVHVHHCLDQLQHMQADGTFNPEQPPIHPLGVPCNGDPLEGLRGCSFHFPDHAAFIRTVNTLYKYDVAMEAARHTELEELLRADEWMKSQPKSQQDILLAWLQREENTLLTPPTQTLNPASTREKSSSKRLTPRDETVGQLRAELVKSLTVSDMDRLMVESGGGDGTLTVLQGLQKDGKTYSSLNMLIGAVAYALNPELQPKEGVVITQAQLMEFILFLSLTDKMNGPKVFITKIIGGSLDIDPVALIASGDPIAPHLYGVAVYDIQVLIGYAFGYENLLGIVKDLLGPSMRRRFTSFQDLKTKVVAEIKRMNPYRSWMGLPASIQDPPDNKCVKEVYDFLFNTNHSTAGPMLASSSSTAKSCRLLPNSQLKLPVQKGDVAVLLRYGYIEEMLKVCDGNTTTSKSTLFILHNLNDPTPRFQQFPNLPELLAAVKKAKSETNDELIEGVHALGGGAREIYSYLQSSAASNGTGQSAVGADLPGMREKLAAKETKEKLELSTELLASLVEAGGPGASLGVEGSSSAVTSSAPPPALTILSHLSLLGEEFSKGQGEQLVLAVKNQKAAAEAMRRALADNIKQLKYDDESSARVAGRPKLLKVIPAKIASTRDQFFVGMEDTQPRLIEIRPFIHTQLPASLVSISTALEQLTAQFAEVKEGIKAYQAVPETDSVTAVSQSLYELFSRFLVSLSALFVGIPGLSKKFNEFFLQLQPLHTSIHAVYSSYYPLFFYLQNYLKPTPHPFFRDLIGPLGEAVHFLGQLRIDTSAILDVQQSLTFVLEKLSPSFTEIHQVLDEFIKVLKNRAGQGRTTEQDPVLGLVTNLSETDQCLLSLLPFLSSMFQTNEHYLPFLLDLVPFFEGQLRPLLPPILPLLIPVGTGDSVTTTAEELSSGNVKVSPSIPQPKSESASGPSLSPSSSTTNIKVPSSGSTTPMKRKTATSTLTVEKASPETKPTTIRIKSVAPPTGPTASTTASSSTGSSTSVSPATSTRRTTASSGIKRSSNSGPVLAAAEIKPPAPMVRGASSRALGGGRTTGTTPIKLEQTK